MSPPCTVAPVPRRGFLWEALARTKTPVLYSNEIAATFVDAGDQAAIDGASIVEPTTLGDLDFSTSNARKVAHRRFKKVLPGIINVRTDGKESGGQFNGTRIDLGVRF